MLIIKFVNANQQLCLATAMATEAWGSGSAIFRDNITLATPVNGTSPNMASLSLVKCVIEQTSG